MYLTGCANCLVTTDYRRLKIRWDTALNGTIFVPNLIKIGQTVQMFERGTCGLDMPTLFPKKENIWLTVGRQFFYPSKTLYS
jgi:hypothetical protein